MRAFWFMLRLHKNSDTPGLRCKWRKANGVDYDLVTVRENIHQYCPESVSG